VSVAGLPHVEMGRPAGRVAPGPAGGRALGAFVELRRDPLGTFMRAVERHGDVVRFTLGPRPVHLVGHLVRHPDHVKHVLHQNSANYRKGLTYHTSRTIFRNGLLTSTGSLWHRQRRLLQPIFQRGRLASFAAAMTDACGECMERWDGHAGRGEAFDVAAEMKRLTLEVVSRTLFSTRLGADAETVREAVAVLQGDSVRRQASLLPLVPVLGRLPTPGNRRWRWALASLRGIVRRMVAERRAAGRDRFGDDLLGTLLAARDEERDEVVDDEQVCDEVLTFMLAGYESTAITLAWAWYLLALNPVPAARLRAEVAEVLGNRVAEFSDVGGLVYTSAVLQETLRVYPPSWDLERDAVDDDEIGGFRIPAGSMVFISPFVTHRHPDFWDDPEVFDPTRFLPGEDGHRRPRPAYLPFGVGPRHCIGHAFATLEATLVLATVARRFRLDLVPGHPVVPDANVTLRPRYGVTVVANRLRAVPGAGS
jgi:cytochrome P450